MVTTVLDDTVVTVVVTAVATIVADWPTSHCCSGFYSGCCRGYFHSGRNSHCCVCCCSGYHVGCCSDGCDGLSNVTSAVAYVVAPAVPASMVALTVTAVFDVPVATMVAAAVMATVTC